MPGDTQNPPKAVQMEGVESAFLAGIQSSGFAVIKQRAEHAGFVHLHLGANGQHKVVPDLLSKGACVVAALPIHLFSSTSR